MDARRYDSMDAYMDIGGRATHGAGAEGIRYDHKEVGGTKPWMVEGRTMH